LRLRRVLPIVKNELKLAFRSKAFLVISGSLLAVVLLDMVALLQGQTSQQPTLAFLNEFSTQVVVYYIGVVAPLLVLVICAPSISLERANGTLRLLLSQDISDNEYLVGKLGGAVFSLWIPIVACLGIYLGLAAALYGVPLDATIVTAVAFSTLNILLYAAVFAALGSMMSTLVRSAAAAVVVAASAFALLSNYAYNVASSVALLIIGGAPSTHMQLNYVYHPFSSADLSFLNAWFALIPRVDSLWPFGALLNLQGQLNPACDFAGAHCTLIKLGPVGFNYIAAMWLNYAVLLTFFSVAFAIMLLYFRRSEK
jgi:ABC-type transport system involved in multi-copper enzyme maturation permease subunit